LVFIVSPFCDLARHCARQPSIIPGDFKEKNYEAFATASISFLRNKSGGKNFQRAISNLSSFNNNIVILGRPRIDFCGGDPGIYSLSKPEKLGVKVLYSFILMLSTTFILATSGLDSACAFGALKSHKFSSSPEAGVKTS